MRLLEPPQRHAIQVRSLGRDMLPCLRLKHTSGPNDPSWVLSGKGTLSNRSQATFTRSSGDPNQVFRYRGFLIRNGSKMKLHYHKTRKQVIKVSFPPGLKLSQPFYTFLPIQTQPQSTFNPCSFPTLGRTALKLSG